MNSNNSTRRAFLLRHLTITIPVIAIIGIVIRWGLYQFGSSLLPYYLTAGVALAWQWYSMALLRWKSLLTRKVLQTDQAEDVAQHASSVWPGIEVIGTFALHTTIAALCGIHFGPWLLSRWFVWIVPLLGISSGGVPSADQWLQHLELVSIIPALVVGYVVSRYFEKSSSWVWILPTIILSYKLSTFTDPHASVFASDHWAGFSYYFLIQQHMPTLNDFGFSGSDPIRVAAQMTVVAPFYSGVAYSIGALLRKYKVTNRIASSFRSEPEPQVFLPEEAGVEWIGETKENSVSDNK
jgi:hypothetical protein